MRFNPITGKLELPSGSGGGGGGGPYLPLAGGIMDTGADIAWANGSFDREAPGGAGREIECSIGYRWQWISGRMNMVQINTNQIIKTIAIDGVNPGVNEDVTAGFVVGSRWETVDGTIYECTDATDDNAVWEARTVASQQVHWQDVLDLQGSKLPTYEIEGNWPRLSTIVREDIDIATTIRLFLKAPKLTSIVAIGEGGGLDSTALANLLADVARNADEFTVPDGTLDMSGNPGTLDTLDSEIAANLAILDDLGWTVTYPILTVPSGTGGSYSGGNATVYWDDLPAWQSVDIEINGLFYTNVGGDTSPYTVSPGAGTTTVFRLRAKSGDVVTDWTSEITVTIPE